MNYENFKNDLNILFDYLNYIYCLEQMINAFNYKYEQSHKSIYLEYINKYCNDNNINMNTLSPFKKLGLNLYE